MRHDPKFRPGPLLRQLCNRKDGKPFADEMAKMKQSYDANLTHNNTVECQLTIFGNRYYVKVVLGINGAKPHSQTIIMALTVYDFSDKDNYIQIDEGFYLSIERTFESGKIFVNGDSITEIRLPIALPAIILDQMIGQPLGKYAETTGILGLYKDLKIKQVQTNQPGDDTFAKILLDGICWEAQLNSAWYTALADAGERA